DEAEDRRQESRARVGGARDLVDESVGVVQKRAVISGVVAPAAVLGQRVGLEGVYRLVVVEGALAEAVEPGRERREEEQEQERPEGVASSRIRRDRGRFAHGSFRALKRRHAESSGREILSHRLPVNARRETVLLPELTT